MFGNSLFKNLAIFITFLSIVTFSFYLNENTNIYTSLQTQSHTFKSFTDRKTILNIFKSSYKVINNHGLTNLIEVSLIKNKNLNNETNQPVPTQNVSTTTISNPFLSTRLTSNNIVLSKITSALTIISNNGSTSINNLELCPLIPPKIEKRIPVNTSKASIADTEHYLSYLSIRPGGLNSPNVCKSRHRVAIIVPYRNREHNLVMFLRHMHPFLNKQQIDYGIFLVEPLEKLTFNRGLLLNIGFLESRKLNDDRWDCFIFHDVDLIPEDERNIYSCPYENPRHMSSAVNTFNYLLPYENIFGGVTSLTKEQMLKVNGYSNLYFGWGAEVRYSIYFFNIKKNN